MSHKQNVKINRNQPGGNIFNTGENITMPDSRPNYDISGNRLSFTTVYSNYTTYIDNFNTYACTQHTGIPITDRLRRLSNQSDQTTHGVVKRNVPTRGNSTKSSITRHRPGGASAPGTGVDVKHGSYARYLAKKKKTILDYKYYKRTKFNNC